VGGREKREYYRQQAVSSLGGKGEREGGSPPGKNLRGAGGQSQVVLEERKTAAKEVWGHPGMGSL